MLATARGFAARVARCAARFERMDEPIREPNRAWRRFDGAGLARGSVMAEVSISEGAG
jgi:hypothetical protein